MAWKAARRTHTWSRRPIYGPPGRGTAPAGRPTPQTNRANDPVLAFSRTLSWWRAPGTGRCRRREVDLVSSRLQARCSLALFGARSPRICATSHAVHLRVRRLPRVNRGVRRRRLRRNPDHFEINPPADPLIRRHAPDDYRRTACAPPAPGRAREKASIRISLSMGLLHYFHSHQHPKKWNYQITSASTARASITLGKVQSQSEISLVRDQP